MSSEKQAAVLGEKDAAEKQERKKRAVWKGQQRYVAVALLPALIELQHDQDGNEREVVVAQGRTHRFKHPYGLTAALIVEITAFLLTFFLPRDVKMAQAIVDAYDATMSRLKIRIVADEQGQAIPKVEVLDDPVKTENPGG